MPQIFDTLDSLGTVSIDFSHSHELHPFPGLRQVLWFRMATATVTQKPAPTNTVFWIESASGRVFTFRISGVGCSPHDLIPHLAVDFCDLEPVSDINNAWLSGWLFPPVPDFRVHHDITFMPTIDTLSQVFNIQFEAMVGLNLVPSEYRCADEYMPIDEDECLGVGSYFDENGLEISLEDDLAKTPSIPCEVYGFQQDAATFVSNLDREVLQFLEMYQSWFQGRDFHKNYNIIASWSGHQRRNRLQALKAFPWLLPEIGLSVIGKRNMPESCSTNQDARAKILSAIDDGRPLMPVLTRHFDVHAHTLRYSRTLLSRHLFTPDQIHTVLRLIDGMKPDQRPVTDHDIRWFHSAKDWVVHWGLGDDRVILTAMAKELFVDGVKGAKNKLARWCPTNDQELTFVDLGHFTQSLYGYIERSGAQELTFRDLLRQWIETAGLKSFIVASERWHQAWSETWSAEGVGRIHDEWPPILLESVRFGTRCIHELHDSESLLKEGQAQRHCVGSFAGRCSRGENFIFSLCDDQSARKSTLHIALYEDRRFFIEDHRGYANSAPDEACHEAARRLLVQLPNLLGSYLRRRQAFDEANYDPKAAQGVARQASYPLEYAMAGEELAPIRRRLNIVGEANAK